jgi:S-formylglutathione hydrolase FrmB
LFCAPTRAEHCLGLRTHQLDRLNRKLHGKIIDYTNHHGADRRIWSPALCHRRNLYVYVPPGFDGTQAYPLMIWLHGLNQDERDYLDDLAEKFDAAIATGCLPPLIIAIPDGSIYQSNGFFHKGSFFLNTDAGNFEDWLMHDVWEFVLAHYPVRPEPEAHILAGMSMGGFAAFNLGIKYRPQFHVIIGIHPPLNLRWVDCHNRYRGNFDPCCWGWRDQLRSHELLGRFYLVYPVRLKKILDPLFHPGTDALARITQENPTEMIETHGLRECDLSMFVGYGGKDQFNVDAQAESFLEFAKQRGLFVTVGYIPNGHHDTSTALKLLPKVIAWLAPQITPYSPPLP